MKIILSFIIFIGFNTSLNAGDSVEKINACYDGSIKACEEVGDKYWRKGKDQNQSKALTFYIKACDADSGYACDQLATMYKYAHGVKRDYTKTVKFLEKSCRLDYVLSCYWLGKMYHEGEGVKQDYSKAKKYFIEEIDNTGNSFSAHVALGKMYESGHGVKQDYSKAKELYETNCKSFTGEGCESLGNLYKYGHGVKQDYFKAVKYYKKHYDRYDESLGLASMYAEGKGIRQNYDIALEIYGKACDNGSNEGCQEYSKLNKQLHKND